MKRPEFPCGFNWLLVGLALVLTAQGQTSGPATGPSARVEGQVISPEGKPVAGAKVKAYDASRLFRLTPLASEPSNLDGGYPLFGSATTDASGHFRIDAPVLNQVIVAVQANGFGLAMEQCATDGLDDPLTIQLTPAMTARVRVIDPGGRPVPNVHIVPAAIRSTTGTYIPYLPNELGAELVQISDASGMCVFPALPAGSRLICQVRDDLFTTAAGIVNQPRADAQPGDVQDFRIEPAGVIEGQVIFGDTTQPAAGVVVLAGQMIGANGRWSTIVTTDNQGTFRIAHLRPGEVQLLPQMTSPSSAKYAATATLVRIDPARVVTGQQLQLIPEAAVVRGRVASTADGAGVAGITVAVEPDRNSLFAIPQSLPRQQATTKLDGSYELMLTPGQYSLVASAADRLNLFPVARASQQITVTGDDPTSVDFQFQPGISPPLGMVEGTIVDEQDHPVAGAAIVGVVSRPVKGGLTIGPGNPARQMAAVLHGVSDANGKFAMDVIGPGVELYVRRGKAVLPQPVWVLAANERPTIVLKETSGTLMVHAVQADGQPVPGAPVRVGIRYNWRQFAPLAGVTDADGTFAVRPYFPDRGYNVSISADGFATTSQEFGTSSSPLGILMRPGATQDVGNPVEPGKTLDVTMKILKTDSFVAGQVVDPSGKPLADAQVNVSTGRGGTRSARTDASGQFRIEGLVAGEQVSITTILAGARSGQPTRVTAGTADAKIVHDPATARAGGRRGVAPPPTRGAQ